MIHDGPFWKRCLGSGLFILQLAVLRSDVSRCSYRLEAYPACTWKLNRPHPKRSILEMSWAASFDCATPTPNGLNITAQGWPPCGLPWVRVRFHAGFTLKGLRKTMMTPKPLQSFATPRTSNSFLPLAVRIIVQETLPLLPLKWRLKKTRPRAR